MPRSVGAPDWLTASSMWGSRVTAAKSEMSPSNGYVLAIAAVEMQMRPVKTGSFRILAHA